jgi:hypothetical protein
MAKIHLHDEQFDGHPHASCGRSDKANAVPEKLFEATDPKLRCFYCSKQWFPYGQPQWHYEQAVRIARGLE